VDHHNLVIKYRCHKKKTIEELQTNIVCKFSFLIIIIIIFSKIELIFLKKVKIKSSLLLLLLLSSIFKYVFREKLATTKDYRCETRSMVQIPRTWIEPWRGDLWVANSFGGVQQYL